MKKIVLMLLVPLVFACKKSPHEANIATVKQYVQSVESLDYVAMESLLAENYEGYGPSAGDLEAVSVGLLSVEAEMSLSGITIGGFSTVSGGTIDSTVAGTLGTIAFTCSISGSPEPVGWLRWPGSDDQPVWM